MKDSKEKLTNDTLTYLKQEGLIPTRAAAQEKPLAKKPLPKPIPKRVEPPPPPPKKASTTAPVPKKESPLLVDAIRKHLPHIPIVETIPHVQTLAILFEDEEELPFLANLKNAIEERFCPCTIAPYEAQEIESFSILLTPRDRGHPKQILLAKAAAYRDNIEEKRALWTQICQILSPKSS